MSSIYALLTERKKNHSSPFHTLMHLHTNVKCVRVCVWWIQRIVIALISHPIPELKARMLLLGPNLLCTPIPSFIFCWVFFPDTVKRADSQILKLPSPDELLTKEERWDAMKATVSELFFQGIKRASRRVGSLVLVPVPDCLADSYQPLCLQVGQWFSWHKSLRTQEKDWRMAWAEWRGMSNCEE